MFIGRIDVEICEDGKIRLSDSIADRIRACGKLYVYYCHGTDDSTSGDFIAYSPFTYDEEECDLVGSTMLTEDNCLCIPSEYVDQFIGECCFIGMERIAELHIAKEFENNYCNINSDDTDILQIAETLDF